MLWSQKDRGVFIYEIVPVFILPVDPDAEPCPLLAFLLDFPLHRKLYTLNII